jgi:hypothetical protein
MTDLVMQPILEIHFAMIRALDFQQTIQIVMMETLQSILLLPKAVTESMITATELLMTV